VREPRNHTRQRSTSALWNHEVDSMSQRLIELANRIQQQPWNRPGSDKTWVLHAMWTHLEFMDEVHRAGRAGGR
jgi:hypothetical protein